MFVVLSSSGRCSLENTYVQYAQDKRDTERQREIGEGGGKRVSHNSVDYPVRCIKFLGRLFTGEYVCTVCARQERQRGRGGERGRGRVRHNSLDHPVCCIPFVARSLTGECICTRQERERVRDR